MSEITALEHPTLKVPYEVFNKIYRQSQKTIDAEQRNFNSLADELEKSLNTSSDGNVPNVVTMLDNVMERLRVLKRKSADSLDEDLAAVRSCKMRIDHLRSIETNRPEFEQKRVNRMLVEHCFRCGFYEAADLLAKKAQVDHLTNSELFMAARDIEASLARKQTDLALAWCAENRSRLRKHGSFFEFYLRQQEVIELIKKGRGSCMDAILHARKHFPAFEEYQQYEKNIQKTMTLLAIPLRAATGDGPANQYQELIRDSRWQWLIEEFRREIVKLYQLCPDSVFAVTLQAGLASLKTPACMTQGDRRNNDCPVCQNNLNSLAEALPFAHCSNSRLVCFISGEPMNETNRAMMLPNGYVYGEKALLSMAENNGSTVICPRTGTSFRFNEAQRVYIM